MRIISYISRYYPIWVTAIGFRARIVWATRFAVASVQVLVLGKAGIRADELIPRAETCNATENA